MARLISISGSALILITAALFSAAPKEQSLLLHQWSSKSKTTDRWAILFELGAKDQQPTDWSGQVALENSAAKITELYYAWPKQTLTSDFAWTAGSRQPARWGGNFGPKPTYATGPVLDVARRAEDVARLKTPAGEATVKLADVTTGKGVPLYEGRARARLVSRTAPLVTGDTEDDFPAAAIGPDGTLHLAYISYTLSEPNRRLPAADLREQPADFAAFRAPTLGDRLWLRSRIGETWSEPVAITSGGMDLCRCAVAAAGDGSIWVGYSSNEKSSGFDIFVRSIRENTPGAIERLSDDAGPDLEPVMVTDQAGNVAIAWQAFRNGIGQILMRRLQDGKWQAPIAISSGANNAWHPALAAGPSGEIAVAWDEYRSGDYDTLVRVIAADGTLQAENSVAASNRFEAKPTVAYDAGGRLWVAYEEGPAKWGKDYGALDANDGKGLYHGHQVRVRCWDGTAWKTPADKLPDAEPNEENRRLDGPQYSFPRIAVGVDGAVWLLYRQAFGRRMSTVLGPYWMSMARRLDGERWSEPIEVLHSDGYNDNRVSVLPRAGDGVWAIHNTDHRLLHRDRVGNDIYVSEVRLPTPISNPVLQDVPAETKDTSANEAEQAAVRAIRDYRIDHAGKKLRLLRGEFHRHTEISWDGRPDGPLTDMFRYALDAASFDWIGNGDHDNGNGREYTWWLTQKLTDAYHTGPSFTPMFTYERSVAYPNGHRNAMFAKRGIRTLPRLTRVLRRQPVVHPDDTKMFYRYLHELDGICASHTSATNMGTDWRDSDPVVEPIVEIYQGDRQNYETPGAPRSPTEQFSLGGYKPKGFIDSALSQGIKLGFQASSDHWSTHISYFIVLAESNNRDSILKAAKQRHCYGATDNIIVDVRSGDHLMGDAFESKSAPELGINLQGTAKLGRVVILRDSKPVEEFRPGAATFKTTWRDPKPESGEHYYYVRVEQENEELAWSSPLWITWTKAQ